VSDTNSNDSLLDKLHAFGEEWETLYRQNTKSSTVTPEDMYLILRLVSAVACPQVMADLADMLQDPQQSFADHTAAVALTLYASAQKDHIQSSLQMRYAAVYMSFRFEQLLESYRKGLKTARRARYRDTKQIAGCAASDTVNKTPTPKKQGSSYALDQLTAEAYNMRTEELMKSAKYNEYKIHVRKIKDEGRAANQFNKVCEQHLLNLIPAREMASPLDTSLTVKPDM